MKDKRKNIIYIIMAGSLWGMISLFIRALNEAGFTSMQCVALRSAVAAIFLGIYLAITDCSKLRIRLKDIKYFIGTGVCSMAFFNYCYFAAIEKVGGAATPALLLYTAPIFVMLMSAVFFHEKITLRKLIALGMTFVGLGFVTGAFGGGEKISGLVIALGLGSGFGYALYSIFGKLVVDKYSAVTITFYTYLFDAIATIPVSGIAHNAELLPNAKVIVVIMGLSIISTILPLLFYTKGLAGLEASMASILATVEPFVASVIGVVFFHEKLTIAKVIGMVLIFAAIIFLNIRIESTKNDISYVNNENK